MDVTHNVVNIFFIDEDFTMTTFHKLSTKFLQGSIGRNGSYLGSRHYAISHFNRTEIECILEDLHLVLDVFLVGCLIDVALNEVVQVFPTESLFQFGFLNFLAHHPQQKFPQRTRKLADWPKQNIKDVSGQGENAHHLVRIDAEERLWKELTGNEHNKCGENRLQEEAECFVRAIAVGLMDA